MPLPELDDRRCLSLRLAEKLLTSIYRRFVSVPERPSASVELNKQANNRNRLCSSIDAALIYNEIVQLSLIIQADAKFVFA